jgi:hypothetical protein
VDIADIGLVHLSGVEDARPRENLTDDERIMLTKKIGCKPVSKSNTSKPGVIRGVCVRTVCAGAGILERRGYPPRDGAEHRAYSTPLRLREINATPGECCDFSPRFAASLPIIDAG